MYGLTDEELSMIQNAIASFAEIEVAKIFGSRVRGDYNRASDVDIAIVGKNITSDIVTSLHFMLEEELPIPYYFDVLNYDSITNIKFRQEIDATAAELYRLASHSI